MHGEEMKYVQEAFDRNWIAPLGFNCDEFENEMSAYLGKQINGTYHSLALCSGTAALHLALKLLRRFFQHLRTYPSLSLGINKNLYSALI